MKPFFIAFFSIVNFWLIFCIGHNFVLYFFDCAFGVFDLDFSNDMMRAAVDNSTLSIMMVDRNLMITYANKSTIDLINVNKEIFQSEFPELNPDNLIGSCIDIFHAKPDFQRNILDDPGNLPLTSDITVGDLIFVINVSAIYHDGEYVGNSLEWSNITDKRNAMDRSARLQTMVETVETNLMMCDLDRNITYCNPSVVSMFEKFSEEFSSVFSGFDPKGLVGRNIDDFHENPNRQKVILKNPENLPYKAEIKIAGLELGLNAMALKDNEGEFVGIAVEWIDYTDRAKYRDEVTGLIDSYNSGDLEARGDLTRMSPVLKPMLDEMNKIIDAVEKASNANKIKGEFLANMSHEIRTPMTAILGYVDLLRNEEVSEEQTKEFLQIIDDNGQHLLVIINDILDISKIEAGKMNFEENTISPVKLCQDVYQMLNCRVTDKDIEFDLNFEFPLPKNIISDEVRLRQILINLIGNALKFTLEGQVKIRVYYQPNLKSLYFEVSDTGIGMSRQQVRNIFEAFSQADNSITRKFGGTGLGLMISNKLASALGGEIKVVSTEGEGSVFTLVMELKDAVDLIDDSIDFENIHQTNKIEDRDYGKTVLLVEDNKTNQLLIKMILTKLGLKVDVLENGLLAIERLLKSRQKYDAVFMDIQMPVMDGLTAMRKLTKAKYSGPVFALTANVMQSDQEEYSEVGFHDFSPKPIVRNDIVRILDKYL